MNESGSLTIFKVLAPIVLIVGIAITMIAGHTWFYKWANSGQRFTVGEQHTIDLPAGEVVVFYESRVSVPRGNVDLIFADEPVRYVRVDHRPEDDSFRCLLGGWSGRPMWKVTVYEPGTYTFSSANDNISRDEPSRSGDRIVFAKEPQTVAQATRTRTVIQIAGGSISVGLGVIMFIVHAVVLRMRAAAAARPQVPHWRR